MLDQRIRDAAAPFVGPGGVPGLVAGVIKGGERTVVTLGDLDVEPGRPVQRDSLFRIASVTKPVAAATVVALIDEGAMTLREPVDRLLPELADRRVLTRPDGPLEETVPAQRPITVHDALTFTLGVGMASGMFRAGEPWPICVADRELSLATLNPPDLSVLQPDADTWIARLGTLPLMAQPGACWFYSTGASVAGVLAMRAAGSSLQEAMRARLFEALGMGDTAFHAADTARLASCYMPQREGAHVLWDPPGGSWSRPPAFEDGAAGLVSTIDDMLAFGAMLLAGGAAPDGTRVLSETGAKAMCTDQLTDAQKASGGGFLDGNGWGYGQAVQDDGSFGWAGGFGSTFLVDPARDLVCVVLTQLMFTGPDDHRVHDAIQVAARAT